MTEPHNGAGPGESRWQSFIGGILDFRFRRNLTMQLLPLFYIVLLLGAAGVILLAVVVVFWLSPMAGLVAGVVAPFAWLAAVAVIRAALEYLVMAYRIMETVQRMNSIPQQVEHLATEFDLINADVRHMRRQVDDMAETVNHLEPALQTLSLPSRLLKRFKS